jgi:menaquinone-dependent protoporphyrinogen oxidase
MISMAKAWILYGTRGGATRTIAGYVENALKGQGYETTVTDARESGHVDPAGYDLIIVGSSIWANRWSGAAAGFLRRNQAALAGKNVALFSSGLSGNDPDKQSVNDRLIAGVAAKTPSIKPVSLAYFGGVVDFDSPNLLVRLTARTGKKDLEKKGIDTTRPYDGRDWTAIWQWALGGSAKQPAGPP